MIKRKFIVAALIAALCLPQSLTAFADSRSVVTLGADLSDQDRNAILRYFGADLSSTDVVYVNNQQERDYLGSYIPLEQIGSHTYSCAYVQPTQTGGIQVKTANLTYVTGNMIATTLSTSGVKNCNVIAASPFPVSGTGALTGVIVAYEQASGDTLPEAKKNLAVEEFVVTQKAADDIGADAALQIVNGIKMEVIQNDVDPEDSESISAIVDQVINNVTVVDNSQTYVDNSVENVDNSTTIVQNGLSDEERQLLIDLAAKVAEQDYKYDDVRETMERVEENLSQITNTSVQNTEQTSEPVSDDGQTVIETEGNTESTTPVEAPEAETPAMPEEESILNNTDDSVFDSELQSTTLEEDTQAQPEGSDSENLEESTPADTENGEENAPAESESEKATEDAAESESETETESETEDSYTNLLIEADSTGVFVRFAVEEQDAEIENGVLTFTAEDGTNVSVTVSEDNLLKAGADLSGLSGTTFMAGIAPVADGKYMCDGTITLVGGRTYTIHEPVVVTGNDLFADDFILSTLQAGNEFDLKMVVPNGAYSCDTVFSNEAVAHLGEAAGGEIAINDINDVAHVILDNEGFTFMTVSYKNEAGDVISEVKIPLQVKAADISIAPAEETPEDMYIANEPMTDAPEDLFIGEDTVTDTTQVVDEPEVLPDLYVED